MKDIQMEDNVEAPALSIGDDFTFAQKLSRLLIAERQAYTPSGAQRVAELCKDLIAYIDSLPAARPSAAPKLTECRHCGFFVALNQAPAEPVVKESLTAATFAAQVAVPTDLDELKDAAALHKMALVPLILSREMRRVTDEEDWQWEDLLAAAEAITEVQYNEIAATPSQAEPVSPGATWLTQDQFQTLGNIAGALEGIGFHDAAGDLRDIIESRMPVSQDGTVEVQGITKKLQAWRDGAGLAELGMKYAPMSDKFADDVMQLMAAYKALVHITPTAVTAPDLSARDAALEEAAQKCQAMRDSDPYGWNAEFKDIGIKSAIDAIRALRSQPAQRGPAQ